MIKMFKEISEEKKNQINSVFPFLKYEELFPFPKTPSDEVLVSKEVEEAYYNFALSVYDHWLSEDESEVISYPSMLAASKVRKYMEYEKKYIKFYLMLFSFDFYLIYKDEYIIQIKSKRDFYAFIKQDIREMRFHRYLVPELGIMISGNFDLTHIVHASKDYYKENEFEKIVKDSGLHILK